MKRKNNFATNTIHLGLALLFILLSWITPTIAPTQEIYTVQYFRFWKIPGLRETHQPAKQATSAPEFTYPIPKSETGYYNPIWKVYYHTNGKIWGAECHSHGKLTHVYRYLYTPTTTIIKEFYLMQLTTIWMIDSQQHIRIREIYERATLLWLETYTPNGTLSNRIYRPNRNQTCYYYWGIGTNPY